MLLHPLQGCGAKKEKSYMRLEEEAPNWKHYVSLIPIVLFFSGVPFVFYFAERFLGEALFLGYLGYVTIGGFGAIWCVVKLGDILDLD